MRPSLIIGSDHTKLTSTSLPYQRKSDAKSARRLQRSAKPMSERHGRLRRCGLPL